MSYAIFRCEGVKSLSDLSNRGKHNKREKESYKTNPDIRIEDSHKNIELIKCDKRYIDRFYEITKDYRLEFNERMKNERSDRKKSFYQMVNDSKSVVADEILFTSDKIFFDSLSEEELMKWANTVLDFVYEDLGYKKEQIIHATLHMDEKTPHIHLVVVPLVKKFDKRINKERYSISKKAYIKISAGSRESEKAVYIEIPDTAGEFADITEAVSDFNGTKDLFFVFSGNVDFLSWRFETDGLVVEEPKPLKEVYSDRLTMGMCLNPSTIGAKYEKYVTSNFSSVTCENEMKADNVLDKGLCQQKVLENQAYVAVNFSACSNIVQYCIKNNLKIKDK